MTALDRLHQAEAAAREAEAAVNAAGLRADVNPQAWRLALARFADKSRDLLAALAEARGEAVVTVNRHMLAQLGPDRWIPATRPEYPLASTDVALFAAPPSGHTVGFDRLPVNETEAQAMGLSYAAPPAALAVPAEKPVPEPHTVDEDCNCEQVGEARGWNECRAAMLAQQPAAAVPEGFAALVDAADNAYDSAEGVAYVEFYRREPVEKLLAACRAMLAAERKGE